MKSTTIISIIALLVLIGAAVFLLPEFTKSHLSTSNIHQSINVTIPNDQQIINESLDNDSVHTVAQNGTMPPLSEFSTMAAKPEINISELELTIHEGINEQRIANGLQPLAYDEELQAIAQGHSQDMSDNNYFSHIDLEGGTPNDRALAAGYNCTRITNTTQVINASGTFDVTYYSEGIGENILQNNLYDWEITENQTILYHWLTLDNLSTSTIQGWMDSPPHRANILDAEYQQEGIGVVIASNEKVYITQDFC